jgi:hypothetical protein
MHEAAKDVTRCEALAALVEFGGTKDGDALGACDCGTLRVAYGHTHLGRLLHLLE